MSLTPDVDVEALVREFARELTHVLGIDGPLTNGTHARDVIEMATMETWGRRVEAAEKLIREVSDNCGCDPGPCANCERIDDYREATRELLEKVKETGR